MLSKAQPNPHESQCQYQSANGSITIMVGPWDMVHFAAMQNKPMTGLGDEAGSGGGGLDVRKGDRGINVNVIFHSGEFWGKAAEAEETKTLAAETKIAPDLLVKL